MSMNDILSNQLPPILPVHPSYPARTQTVVTEKIVGSQKIDGVLVDTYRNHTETLDIYNDKGVVTTVRTTNTFNYTV